MKLTDHFTLEELTFSEYAARNGMSNEPTPDALGNLRFLAERLEEVRTLLASPIRVTSGYRARAVNAGVGGAANSQHVLGLAADIVVPEYGTPYEVASAIAASALPYDQVIHEFGRWTHVSFTKTPRRQKLSIFKRGQYLPGIVKEQ